MPSNHADLVVLGARIHTGAAGAAGAAPPQAIALRGDRIARIGAAADMKDLLGRRTRVIDVPAGLIVPGFQDAHVHPPQAGRELTRVWLHDLRGKAAYLDAIAAYADSHPDEPWILGGGWAMEYFPGGTPRKEDLDAVVPDRPVFLFNRDVHGAWVNSAALERAGIGPDTSDPVDGRIERDPQTGEPSGTLHEGAAYRVDAQVVPAPSAQEWREATLAGQAHLHARGITGWQDAWVTPPRLEAYRSLAADGRLTARVVGALWWERDRGLDQLPELLAQRERAAGAAEQSGAPVAGFFPTTVKIMVDGVLENQTGALLEPYCDGCGGETDNRGIAFVEREPLIEAVTALDRLGFQVHMHAIGDRAVRHALDAVEAARTANGPSRWRHHIAHLQVVHPNDIPRFAALGVVPNCQAYWAQDEPQMEALTTPFLGPERAGWQYPFEALRAAGARLAMGSDWGVSTANPLEQLEVAITRIDPEHRENPAFLPAQRLSPAHAFEAFTAGSAYVNHDEDAGTLQVGLRADLAVLDTDIFADGFISPSRAPLADVSVQLTVASGQVVHDATR